MFCECHKKIKDHHLPSSIFYWCVLCQTIFICTKDFTWTFYMSGRMCPIFIYRRLNLYPFLYLFKFVLRFGLSYFCLPVTYFHYLVVFCHLFTCINEPFYSSIECYILSTGYMEVIGFRQVV